MRRSNQHLHCDVPAILVGAASGQLKGDRQLPFPGREVSTGKLLLSILNKFDPTVSQFGDSTGRIESI